MKDHAFYLGLLVVGLIGFAFFAPENAITGLPVQDCPDCDKLCDVDAECQGTVCCPTNWESGVCQYAQNCAAIAELSMQESYQEYAHPERPQAIRNIAWKNFGIPLLVILGVVAFIATRKHG